MNIKKYKVPEIIKSLMIDELLMNIHQQYPVKQYGEVFDFYSILNNACKNHKIKSCFLHFCIIILKEHSLHRAPLLIKLQLNSPV